MDSFTSRAERQGMKARRPRLARIGYQESGAIIAGWLVKLTIALVVIFVVGYDAIAITYNNVSTAEDARLVAREAADAKFLKRSTNAQAVAAAEARADAAGVELNPEDVVFYPDGSVEVTVSSSIDTILVQHIGPIAEWDTAVETYTSPPLN